jgi:hypothetical protein
LPHGGRVTRFAVGTPLGPSSNSWKVSTTKAGDIYIAGRDNFHGSKVSLHKSGRWRLAQNEDAVAARPDLTPAGADRAVVKWDAPPGWRQSPIVAFRVVILSPAVYLSATDRTDWKRSVLFIEPHPDSRAMTVVSVCVVPDDQDFDYSAAVGGKLAVLDLTEGVHAHVIATHAPAFESGLEELGSAVLEDTPGLSADELKGHVVLVHGFDDDGVHFFMPLPLSMWTGG